MVDPEAARAALNEIDERYEQVSAEAAAHRPPGWIALLVVPGFYAVLGGTDFEFPYPLLCFAGGGLLVATGMWLAIRHSRPGAVRQRRGMFNTRNTILNGVWLVAIFASMVAGKALLDDHVADRMISVYAAIPAAVLFTGYLAWLRRVQFGKRRR